MSEQSCVTILIDRNEILRVIVFQRTLSIAAVRPVTEFGLDFLSGTSVTYTPVTTTLKIFCLVTSQVMFWGWMQAMQPNFLRLWRWKEQIFEWCCDIYACSTPLVGKILLETPWARALTGCVIKLNNDTLLPNERSITRPWRWNP